MNHRARELLSIVTVGAGLGGVALAILTTLERVLLHDYIYLTAADIALHASWAILAAATIAAITSTAIVLVYGTATRWVTSPSLGVLAIVGAFSGALVGSFAYRLVVIASKYGAMLPAWAGTLMSAAAFAAVGAVCLPLFLRAYDRWPRIMTTLLIGATAVTAYVDLHRYIRAYGNVHLILGVLMLATLGLLGAKALHACAPTLRRRLTWGLVALVVGSATCIGVLAPTPGARTAVLIYGSIEKTVIRHVLWPAFDGDGDGFSPHGLGVDCDDAAADIHPLASPMRSRSFACEPIRARGDGTLPAVSPRRHEGALRSVVWVMIDTLRPDVTAKVADEFRGFTSYGRYRSCGSDTKSTLSQLLGTRGCRPNGFEGSVVTALDELGLETNSFLQYDHRSLRMTQNQIGDVFDRFADRMESTDEGEVLAAAAVWISTMSESKRPFFAYVHLEGGHAPYHGSGRTPRERYEDACLRSLEGVAGLVNAISEEHIVVVMGDHGEEFGEHDGTAHGYTMFEELLATPLLVRGMSTSGDANDCALGCSEVSALVHDAATGDKQVRCAPPSDGRLAQVDIPSFASRRPSAVHLRALYLPERRKVTWDAGLDIWGLYDLKHDPAERNNLAMTRPTDLREAAGLLADAMERCPHANW